MPKIVCPERPCARCKTADREISSYCYPCHNLNGREAAAKKGGYRSEHLFRKYGITGEEADQMLIDQGGVCAVCHRAARMDAKKPWHVDHDHKTGKTRGILCHHCNTALGNLQDDITILKSAIRYLEEHNG